MTATLQFLLTRSVQLASEGNLPAQRRHIHKACTCCGRVYSREQWARLPLVGVQRLDETKPLELRNCSCGSTISVEVL